MKSYLPIPRRLLPSTIEVYLPDDHSGFLDPITVRNVAVQLTQTACNDEHRSADAGAGIVFIDAMNSTPLVDVPVGARIGFEGISFTVFSSTRFETVQNQVHHWELVIR